MPYLTDAHKHALDVGGVPETPGELTYLVTRALLGNPREASMAEALQAAVDRYLSGLATDPGYVNYCVIIGALTCAALEHERRLGTPGDPYDVPDDAWNALQDLAQFEQDFYRNVIGPYEDTKIAENGDVYP